MTVHTGDLLQHAKEIRHRHHGNRLTLHSVVYPIDYCTSGCTYCGLSKILTKNKAHSVGGGMPNETFSWLIGGLRDVGYQVHELVFGTVAEDQTLLADRIVRWVDKTRELHPDSYIIVNCDTLQPSGYRRLKDAGTDAVWTFIEAMDPELFRSKHLFGLKADHEQRLEAPLRIRDAGMDVGNALLWGLTENWESEFDAFVNWSRSVGGFDFMATPVLQEVTVPTGAIVPPDFDLEPALRIGTELYAEICTKLRIAFPESRLVGNTRLDPKFVYGEVSKVLDMCNGYVWAGSRSHPKGSFAKQGLVQKDGTQMNFYEPGVTREEIQSMCPDEIRVDLSWEFNR